VSELVKKEDDKVVPCC